MSELIVFFGSEPVIDMAKGQFFSLGLLVCRIIAFDAQFMLVRYDRASGTSNCLCDRPVRASRFAHACNQSILFIGESTTPFVETKSLHIRHGGPDCFEPLRPSCILRQRHERASHTSVTAPQGFGHVLQRVAPCT